jgi:hypothetical protein
MRDRAARSGKLATTAEQQVIRVEDSGQPVYEILPTNPTVVYVPVYDPYWIWGTPVYYPYARWYYPPHAPYLYFGSAVYIDAYFGTRWYGSPWNGPGYQAWNSWGWRPAWNSHNVVVNNVFINNQHFNTNRSYGTGTIAWSHEVEHRRGVVYPATASFDRYRRDSRDFSRPQQAAYSQGRSAPAQLSSRSAGTLNVSNTSSASRTVERSSGRSDVRQDARVDTRQDSRPVARPDTRQDTRVAGRDATPSSPSRDNRVSSDVRNDRGSSYTGSNRASSSTTPITTTRSTQLALSRPSTPAPNVGSSQGSSWSGTRNPTSYRESPQGRSVGPQTPRPETPTSYRGTTSDRGRQDYPSVRQAGPGVGASSPTHQASLPRQSEPARQSAPQARYAPEQRSAPPSSVQSSPRQSAPQARYAPEQRSAPPSSVQSSPRQSAPQGGASSAVRSAPAQHQEASSSNSQGGGRSSSDGSNGGGNSRGRR